MPQKNYFRNKKYFQKTNIMWYVSILFHFLIFWAQHLLHFTVGRENHSIFKCQKHTGRKIAITHVFAPLTCKYCPWKKLIKATWAKNVGIHVWCFAVIFRSLTPVVNLVCTLAGSFFGTVTFYILSSSFYSYFFVGKSLFFTIANKLYSRIGRFTLH